MSDYESNYEVWKSQVNIYIYLIATFSLLIKKLEAFLLHTDIRANADESKGVFIWVFISVHIFANGILILYFAVLKAWPKKPKLANFQRYYWIYKHKCASVML